MVRVKKLPEHIVLTYQMVPELSFNLDLEGHKVTCFFARKKSDSFLETYL